MNLLTNCIKSYRLAVGGWRLLVALVQHMQEKHVHTSMSEVLEALPCLRLPCSRWYTSGIDKIDTSQLTLAQNQTSQTVYSHMEWLTAFSAAL